MMQILCQEILKELKSLENAIDYKVIDVWLLLLIYMNGDSMRKTVERLFLSKIINGCFEDALIDQCIQGNKEVMQERHLPCVPDIFYLLLSLSFSMKLNQLRAKSFHHTNIKPMLSL